MTDTTTPRPTRTHVLKLRVTQAEREALQAIADADDRTVSSVLRRALRELIASGHAK